MRLYGVCGSEWIWSIGWMMLICEKWSTGWNIFPSATVYHESYMSWVRIKTQAFKQRGHQHKPCMAMELSLRNRLWKGDLKLHTSRLNTVALALNIGLYYHRIWFVCHWNKCTVLVKCISHALIFQSKSCNVGPETAHFSCNKAFCMSPCRTERHSIIISWWSVSSSGTLAIIWKYSCKN
jgi:hypothetical protein